MADFNSPSLTSLYTDFLTKLKDIDSDMVKWLDDTNSTNTPSGAKRWNSTNNYFEKFNGTSWSPLTTRYMIDVNTVKGCTINDLGTTTSDIWTANKIASITNNKLDITSYTATDILTKLKTVDGTSSGLDADLLDGMNTSTTNIGNTVVIRDGTGNFSAGTITATLNGNASTATTAGTASTLTTSRNINLTGVITGTVSFNGGSDVTMTTAYNVSPIPSGVIVLWSGSAASIPSGWYLCNGYNNTPNLTDRFVIGAGSSYGVSSTGGSKDSILVSHTHSFSATTSTSGSHQHTEPIGYVGVFGAGSSGASGNYGGAGYGTRDLTESAGSHNHTVSGSTDTQGVSGTNANLPPYYALCYIMKG